MNIEKESSAKSVLSPFTTGNGYDSWKRLMKIRMHPAKLYRTSISGSKQFGEGSDNIKDQTLKPNTLFFKTAPQNANHAGSWSFGDSTQVLAATASHAASWNFGDAAQILPVNTPKAINPPLPDISSVTNRSKATSLMTNTRGLVILSDTIHARTRKRIQRYSSARKRGHMPIIGTNAPESSETSKYDTLCMILVPEVRMPATASCPEEVDKFNRIIWWLQDCKAAMAAGDMEPVPLPIIGGE